MENNDFIFGIRPIIEAVRSGKTIDKLLVKKGLKGELSAELDELIRENHLNCQLVPEEKLNRITRKNHQGVIAFISPIPFYDLDEIIARTYENGQTPFFIYLDQITDVRNFGAIVRTAECAGVQAIIIPEKGAAQIGGDAVKTSAGALHILPVCKIKNPYKTLVNLQENGIKIFAASEKATNDYSDKDYKVPCTIVMGSEDKGISPEILKIADELIRIPIMGKIESLNVSVAAGILLYEVVKQRK
ncbi:MAG TPA: 23S rRNA (guanosine(2251)-2'-O)-methyltransferase RlmB [Prolixibacteraceae bacterium]|nr:23S rRNA (guanosine(2251)-2'-O)-methyltransferase RlmB [Prolixibacteraceae bacterium]HPS13393.1 23S rRNA (guanosine(2251)-2'-O)-methyltransferase RlmB [Prolixibacteraceae bacterium]